MRSLAVCMVRPGASAALEAFEQEVLEDVLQPLGARQDSDDTGLTCSLFRRRDQEEGEPPEYLCRVYGDGAGDRLDGLRDALEASGADVVGSQPLHEVGSVPDDATARTEENAANQLLTCRILLEPGRETEAFERLLLEDVLRSDAERGATRTNTFKAFRLFRDEEPSRDPHFRYVAEARGSFFFPNLFPGTVERIQEAGARVMDPAAFAHVGSVQPQETEVADERHRR